MRNAMIIDPQDNVAVAIEPIAKGETATYVCESKEFSLPVLEDITISWLPAISARGSLW